MLLTPSSAENTLEYYISVCNFVGSSTDEIPKLTQHHQHDSSRTKAECQSSNKGDDEIKKPDDEEGYKNVSYQAQSGNLDHVVRLLDVALTEIKRIELDSIKRHEELSGQLQVILAKLGELGNHAFKDAQPTYDPSQTQPSRMALYSPIPLSIYQPVEKVENKSPERKRRRTARVLKKPRTLVSPYTDPTKKHKHGKKNEEPEHEPEETTIDWEANFMSWLTEPRNDHVIMSHTHGDRGWFQTLSDPSGWLDNFVSYNSHLNHALIFTRDLPVRTTDNPLIVFFPECSTSINIWM